MEHLNIEVSPESEFIRHAEMLRLGLQTSVENGFLSQEKANEWFAAWLDENSQNYQYEWDSQ